MSAITESASAVGEAIVGDDVSVLIATLGRATPQQIAAIRAHLGMEAVSVKAEKPPKPVKLTAPKTAKAVKPAERMVARMSPRRTMASPPEKGAGIGPSRG